ncbi:alpha-hydroxy acid oxidase [Halomonas sp. KO116]|uniref:alpha-hydroxy acid oxidase n=1 Tax=Halomonas sp. KO116 TaxID=1504981 RepID=UPI0004E44A1B|nr:alpha-hydroxy acid oxidase [Halomonas sp. KO116]AJY50068.1 (S)-mandelate dehydrogenase [Halomonas sp. KO116]
MHNIEHYRRSAQKKLPKFVFDYLEGGACDEICVGNNILSIKKIKLKPKNLNVKNNNKVVSLLGAEYQVPLGLSPIGLAGVFYPNADIILAKSAKIKEIPFILSTASNNRIEDVIKITEEKYLWFQLYAMNEKITKNLLERLVSIGCKNLVITVDVPISGKRERDLYNGFKLPFKLSHKNIYEILCKPSYVKNHIFKPRPKLVNIEDYIDTKNSSLQAKLLNRSMNADFDMVDLKKLRDIWPYNLIVKGIMDKEEAIDCESIGVDAIIVSNHGGRQLDSCISPIDVVKEISESLKIPVMIDGGIRRGEDIFKAKCLGAQMVFIGRPAIYGLASMGERGVKNILDIFIDEYKDTLMLAGYNDESNLFDFIFKG